MIAEPQVKKTTKRVPSRPRGDGQSREFSGDTRPRQATDKYSNGDTPARNHSDAGASPPLPKYQPFDAEDEEAFWEGAHVEQIYAGADDFERYAAAYRIGFEGFNRLGAQYTFDDVEEDLQEEYEAEGSPMSWERAREASRAAWDRLEERRMDAANAAGALVP